MNDVQEHNVQREKKRANRQRKTCNANFHFTKYREAIFDMLSFGDLKALQYTYMYI